MHGADLFSDSYNIETGAIYTANATTNPPNHDVVLIGWDDNYSLENFNEGSRPTKNGAWIVKNSWGTKVEATLEEMREAIFGAFEDKCKEEGWNTAEEIPAEFAHEMFKQLGYTIENGKAVLKVGDDGFMYVSYEDATIYSALDGIEKAYNEVKYDYLYHYDEFGGLATLPLNEQRIYIGNVFEKQSEGKEYLSEVGIIVPETSTCKIYVNPNGEGKSQSDLTEVKLKTGSAESFNAGYHTVELLEPIEIKSDKFVVVAQLTGTRTDGYGLSIEMVIDDTAWSVVDISQNTSFWTTQEFFPKNDWIAFSEMSELSSGRLPDCDDTLRAFTVSEIEEDKLEKIEITTPPTKVEYKEGEDFDKTGMVVTAYFNDGTSKPVTDYTIKNGTDLKADQTVVVIEYKNKSVTQTIKVTPKTTDDGDGDDDDKTVKAESTDFTKVKPNVKSVKAYYFTDKNKKEYVTMDLGLESISRKENDTYKYYYYLSSSPSKTDITDWTEIKQKQTSMDKIEFVVDTNDIKNYEEVIKAQKLYIYIKEEVTKSEEKAEIITKAIELQTEGKVEVYKDGVKQTASNDNNNNNNNNNQGKDDTTANQKLPAAGLKIGIGLVIVAVAVFGIIKFIQYKKMNF